MRIGLIVLVCATLPLTAAHAKRPNAEASFARLKTLVGTWRATSANGRPTITYRLSAGGTVLVETWTLSPTRESLTLYHLDGRSLIATHYCPIGNQPRLRLAEAGADRLRFAFRDATNLDRSKDSHQHALSLRFDGDRIVREETYRERRKDETDVLTFERTAP